MARVTTPMPQAVRDRHDATVGDIVDRLAREFGDEVPRDAIYRCVDAAREAVTLFGEAPESMPRMIEQIAREDLRVLAGGQESLARLKPMNRPKREG